MIALPYSVSVPGYVPPPPKIRVRFRLLRDGEVTAGTKIVRVYRSWIAAAEPAAAFESQLGEYTAEQLFDLATLLAHGSWLVAGDDQAAPKRTRAAYLELNASGTYTFDITQDSSTGAPTFAAAYVG